MMKTKPVIAVFDFDGTISYRDSLVPFLFFVFGRVRTTLKLLLCVLPMFGYVLGLSGRQQVKERILNVFFRGISIDKFQKLGKSYATEDLIHRLRPESVKRIQWHQDQGHRCYISSASIETYLEPLAKLLGFDECFCSRIETVDGKVTGKLKGPNCRGAEKVRRLEELLGSLDAYDIYAYGDSDGDRELLAVADHPFYKSMGG